MESYLKKKIPSPIPSKCPVCNVVFPSKTQLMKHRSLERHGVRRGIESLCPECKVLFHAKRELEAHSKLLHPKPKGPFMRGEPKAQCHICDARFYTHAAKNDHEKIEHVNSPVDVSDLGIEILSVDVWGRKIIAISSKA